MPRRKKTPQRPAPLVLGDLRARVVRGPHKQDRTQWYWRIANSALAGKTVASGWFTVQGVTQKIAELIAGIEEREAIVEAVEEKEDHPKTVAELLDFWQESQEDRPDLEENTRLSRTMAIRRITRLIGKTRLTDVNLRLMESFRNRRLRQRDPKTGRGGAPATIQLDFTVLGMAWVWAKKQKYVEDVLPRVRIRSERRNNHRTPPVEEARAVLDDLDGWARVAYAILFFTGCRAVAADRLTWSAVNLDKGTLNLIGKARKERTIPIPMELRAILTAWKAERTAQFHPDAKVIPLRVVTELRRRMARSCDRLGIEVFTPHALRRLRVRSCRRSGVPIRTAADYLGHSPQVMIELYDASSEEDLRSVVDLCFDMDSDPDQEQ